MKFKDKMKTIRERVIDILRDVPEAKDWNDNLLAWEYWARYNDPQIKNFIYVLGREKISFGLEKFESIRRIRQKIQNEEGLFKPTADVMTRRLEKQAEMLKWLRDDRERQIANENLNKGGNLT